MLFISFVVAVVFVIADVVVVVVVVVVTSADFVTGGSVEEYCAVVDTVVAVLEAED